MSSADSTSSLSRRQILQAAGGVTLLALVPRVGHSETDAVTYEPALQGKTKGRPPVFTALPYLQPGPHGSKLVEGQESIVIAWQTDETPAQYEVTYGEHDLGRKADVGSQNRLSIAKGESEGRINYAALLTGLNLGTKYRYRVSMDGSTLLEGFFTTRKPRGRKTRFVSFGDNSYGDISDRAVAFQSFRAMPDFVMNAGDNVYEKGLDSEYTRYFFPVYNADQAGERIGAPLLRAVPFYTVLANHDISGKDANGAPAASFTKDPDSLGYFTNMHLPLNGPSGILTMPIDGPKAALDGFRTSAGDRYPTMGNYSFDYGDGHFLCLDSNVYIDPTAPKFQEWIEQDLASTDAVWKFVVYHHPAYNVGNEHYDEQHMRVLSPLFEKHGVALVLSGHEHTYQRTRPLTFVPKDVSGAQDVNGKQRLVPGEFTIDRAYDGVKTIRPQGIIYLTTGAGGKHLYDAAMNDNPQNWTHEEDNHSDYAIKVISDRHSITVIDMDPHGLDIRQVDQWGNQVDAFRITH